MDRSSETTRAGIQDTARTLTEHEARLAYLEAQKRSTAAAIAVAERNHATYISRLCAHSRQPPPVSAAQQPPASANLATFVAPPAQQPASANLATFVAPTAQHPLAPATSAISTGLAGTRPLGTTVPAATRPSATIAPAVTFSARPNIRCRPTENPRPPHPGRSLSRVSTGSPFANRLPPPTTIPTWSFASPS